MREIVFDTETTGFDPKGGDRIVEIGAMELINHLPTGRTFHVYINPERSMPDDAFQVHGLGDDFLHDKPKFAEIAQDWLDFIGPDSKLIAHNANFDRGFLDMELGRLGHPPLDPARVIDTLAIAKRKFPGAPASLDALCRRFGVDNSGRDLHGALIDTELLAGVYLELIGGRQPDLVLAGPETTTTTQTQTTKPRAPRPRPLPSRLTADEEQAHADFIARMGDKAYWITRRMQ
ncbi:DNA polymerase III subunit epsilon [Paracoccus sp. (in: a-proteobacteria)]|uniref:DNA polymerase III subunit epsilon n=1 Tax=Paracoccus sp. TaxID=267 RepID=UPI0026E0ED55|nr:DNA polymerase III subunit epsilon [Paracoccus sp. (in: a-proteobacteria)]MDO5647494.1 DNA polymerase III subunit epsilon [Paracoccus sp. (in: a-proteobacteria)]